MKVLCEKCGSVLNSNFIGEDKLCPVCGANLDDDSQTAPGKSNEITWYFYGFKDSDAYSLRDKPIDLDKFGDTYYLKYTFQAPPRDAAGSSDRAKEILRQKYPDAFAPPKPERSNEPHCPRCGSTHIELLQKKWSIWTGFRTSAVQRVCVNCKHKF